MTPSQKREERIRLAANCLNIISAGCFLGAIVTAPLAWIMKTPRTDTFPFIFVGICVGLGVIIHLMAQLVLRRL